MSLADELSAAARRASDRLAQNIQESVPWDVNTQTAQARRVPLRFEIAGVTLEIAQSGVALDEPGAPQSGTGSVVWTAAVGLARYLEHAESLDGKRVLELGAGTARRSKLPSHLNTEVRTPTRHTAPDPRLRSAPAQLASVSDRPDSSAM